MAGIWLGYFTGGGGEAGKGIPCEGGRDVRRLF